MAQLSILVVDDDRDDRESLMQFLLLEQYQAEAVGSAAAALDLVRKRHFHVIVLDLVLNVAAPTLDGLDLLRQIREIDREVEVLILTGNAAFAAAQDAIRYRVFRFLEKATQDEHQQLLEALDKIALDKGLVLDGEQALRRRIGRRLRGLRTQRGMTLRDAFRKTELSVSQISQIERAETSPTLTALYRLAAAYGVDVQGLFDDGAREGAEEDA